MKQIHFKSILLFIALSFNINGFAYDDESHRYIVKSAMEYIKNYPDLCDADNKNTALTFLCETQNNRISLESAYQKLSVLGEYQSADNSGGQTYEGLATSLANHAVAIDYREDTSICFKTDGPLRVCKYRPYDALLDNVSRGIVDYIFGEGGQSSFTSVWHYQDYTRGPDSYHNRYGGLQFSYFDETELVRWQKMLTDPSANTLEDGLLFRKRSEFILTAGALPLSSMFELDNGKEHCFLFFYLWPEWFRWLLKASMCSKPSHDSLGTTAEHYRLSYGNSDMDQENYSNIYTAEWQPISNLITYWMQRFTGYDGENEAESTEAEKIKHLGYALHAADLLQPHHTWVTLVDDHSGWETWTGEWLECYGETDCDESRFELSADFDLQEKISDHMDPYIKNYQKFTGDFNHNNPNLYDKDLLPLLETAGGYSYANGAAILWDYSDSTRLEIAADLIPNAIALTVYLLVIAAHFLPDTDMNGD